MAISPKSYRVSSLLPILLLIAIHVLPFFSSASFSIDVNVKLVRVDAHTNLTYHERIHRAMRRSHQRAVTLHQRGRRRRRHRAVAQPPNQNSLSIETPLQAGHGEFLMKIEVGTPATAVMVVVDTASDLVWTDCSPDQTPRGFDPQSSTSYSKLPCSNPSCSALPSICDPMSGDCRYFYKYEDDSTTIGYLSSDSFTLGSTSFENIVFGCSTMNWGFHDGAGLIGLNRGRLSLISQIGNYIDHQFSYCFSGLDGGSPGSSRLSLGPNSSFPTSSAAGGDGIALPMSNRSRKPDFYYVDLEGISVGGKRLPIEASAFDFNRRGTGGVVVDSGSALTYLVAEAYREVEQAFVTAIGLPIAAGPTHGGSSLCFQGSVDPSSIPSLTLHFAGGDFRAPPENYFIVDKDTRLSCLAIHETPVGTSILGAFMQQNVHVHYDLGNSLITFTPAPCDQL